MRPDPVVEFWLGMGAIIAALAVALLLAFPPSWMDSRQGAVANFTNVSHLAEGSTVSSAGFVWGTVTKIDPLGGYFRVHMKLKPGFAMTPDQGLALEETNPLQAASLVVGRQCKLVAGAPIPQGCCPQALTRASATPTESGLASCGHLPSLIDQAVEAVLTAKNRIGTVSDTITSQVNTRLAPLMDKASVTLDASKATMTSALATSEKARGVLNDNSDNLKATLARTNNVLANVESTSKSVDTLMKAKSEQLDTSITNFSSILATTAATMPGVVDNLQKSAEDLRAITGQVRNEPTSLVRRRERADPSFVDPAAE